MSLVWRVKWSHTPGYSAHAARDILGSCAGCSTLKRACKPDKVKDSAPAGEVLAIAHIAKAPVQKDDAAVVMLVADAAPNRLVQRPASHFLSCHTMSPMGLIERVFQPFLRAQAQRT